MHPKILHTVYNVKRNGQIFRQHSSFPNILEPKNVDLNFAISRLFRK